MFSKLSQRNLILYLHHITIVAFSTAMLYQAKTVSLINGPKHNQLPKLSFPKINRTDVDHKVRSVNPASMRNSILEVK